MHTNAYWLSVFALQYAPLSCCSQRNGATDRQIGGVTANQLSLSLMC